MKRHTRSRLADALGAALDCSGTTLYTAALEMLRAALIDASADAAALRLGISRRAVYHLLERDGVATALGLPTVERVSLCRQTLQTLQGTATCKS